MNTKQRSRTIAPIPGEILEELPACTLMELAETTGVPAETLVEYVEVGVIEPTSGGSVRDWRFAGNAIVRLKRAQRLQQDFLLEPEPLALILDLLEEIDDLRARLRHLRLPEDIV